MNSQGANGTVQSHDAEVTTLRQHGALGVVWQPVPRLRFAGRLEARWTDLDAHANQGRDLGTFQLAHAEVERDNWSLNGRADGRLGFGARNAVELEARGGLRRGPDDWDLSAGGSTLCGFIRGSVAPGRSRGIPGDRRMRPGGDHAGLGR